MEYSSLLQFLFKKEVVCFTAEQLSSICLGRSTSSTVNFNCIESLLDELGDMSAKAQNLSKPVTSFKKFKNSNHKIYLILKIEGRRVLGFLKVGRKRLFIHDKNGYCTESEPLCVLDFYVHHMFQRKGYGKHLFDYMLQVEQVIPSSLAIDSPSEKMLHFLKKHYQLNNPYFASNNFVIYPNFFDSFTTQTNQIINRVTNPIVKRTKLMQMDKFNLSYQNSKYPIVNSNNNKPDTTTRSTNTSGYCLINSSPDNCEIVKSNQFITPHTRIDPMPTRLTVIKPTLDSISTNNVEEVENFRNEKPLCSELETSSVNPRSKSVCPTFDLCPEHEACQLIKSSISNTSNEKINFPFLSNTQWNNVHSVKFRQRSSANYSYLNAVRNHNGHTRLW